MKGAIVGLPWRTRSAGPAYSAPASTARSPTPRPRRTLREHFQNRYSEGSCRLAPECRSFGVPQDDSWAHDGSAVIKKWAVTVRRASQNRRAVPAPYAERFSSGIGWNFFDPSTSNVPDTPRTENLNREHPCVRSIVSSAPLLAALISGGVMTTSLPIFSAGDDAKPVAVQTVKDGLAVSVAAVSRDVFAERSERRRLTSS